MTKLETFGDTYQLNPDDSSSVLKWREKIESLLKALENISNSRASRGSAKSKGPSEAQKHAMKDMSDFINNESKKLNELFENNNVGKVYYANYFIVAYLNYMLVHVIFDFKHYAIFFIIMHVNWSLYVYHR